MKTAATHNLIHPIIRETQVPGQDAQEEELKPAGFCVVVRRAKAKDMRIMDDLGSRPVAMTEAFIAKLSNLAAEEVALLDAEDFDFLADMCVPNMGAGQKTGETG